jgi:hypothetical protein
MREKKQYIVLTFHTTTEAMAAEKQCGVHGIPGRLIPIPREITAGCGLAWRMSVKDYMQNKKDLQELGLCFDQAVELTL